MNFATPGATAFLNGTVLPATLWVQLHTGDPTAAGTANIADLGSRRSFTRTTSADGTSDNDSLIQWLAAPSDENLTHISVWSAETAGTCWLVGAITDAPALAITGQNAEIQIGELHLDCEMWS